MKCAKCGGKLRRIHRSFFEHFGYMAVYACGGCEHHEFVPRRFQFHLGPSCRCPKCGTYRVVRLKHPDKIDQRHRGFLNLVERIAGNGHLFHCRWCRLQFFDRRELAAQADRRSTAQSVAREAEKTAGPAN